MLQVYWPCSFFLLPQGSIHPRARCAWAWTIRDALSQVHTLTIDQVLYAITLYLTKTHANSIIVRNQSNLTLSSEFLSDLTPLSPSNLKFYCSPHLWCSCLWRCLCNRWRAYQSCYAFNSSDIHHWLLCGFRSNLLIPVLSSCSCNLRTPDDTQLTLRRTLPETLPSGY